MGLWCPCVSLAGAVYFAASAHITLGLLMTGYLSYVFMYISFTSGFRGDSSFFLILMMYSCTFLALGCLIFRGVETKSIRLLKPATITFAVIHSLLFVRVVYVILVKLVMGATGSGGTTYSRSDEDISSDNTGLVFFTLLFLGTVIYLALLTIHIRNLQNMYSIASANVPGHVYSQVQLQPNGNAIYTYNTVVCNA